MIYDHPMNYIAEVLWPKILYGNQPAGWDIAGTKESVSGITRDKLVTYRKKQYVPSNTVLCVAGNFVDSKLKKMIKKYFANVIEGNAVEKLGVVEKQNKPNCLLDYRKTDQSHLFLGVRGYNVFHPQRYTQDILGIILGGMMSSRLFVEVRDKLGLAYYIKTDVEANPDTGYFAARAGVDNQRIEKAVSAILKEYKKMSRNKISESELKKSKDNFKGRLALLLESSDARASFYATQEIFERKIMSPKEIMNEIDKITTDDILKVAKDIFKPKNLNLALVGPYKDKEKFKKLLKL